ncbi:MAG: hypothetical protein QG604_102 [Candidatus Dependentiae bacterium]|nr:hypothetical protein [Candidatus Dependentiae bacterium]
MKNYFLLASLSMASSLIGSDATVSPDPSPFKTPICMPTGGSQVFCDAYFAKEAVLEEVSPGLSKRARIFVLSITNKRTDQKQIRVSIAADASCKDPFSSEMISYWYPDYEDAGVGFVRAKQRVKTVEIASAFVVASFYKQLPPISVTHLACGAILFHCLFEAWGYMHKKSYEGKLPAQIAHFKKCIPWNEEMVGGRQDFIFIMPLGSGGTSPEWGRLVDIQLLD